MTDRTPSNEKNGGSHWDFYWPTIDVVLSSKSSIDLHAIRISNRDSATAFLLNYGYDPDNPSHARRIHQIIIESICFIEWKLMPKEWQRGRRPPPEILYCKDARDLILMASNTEPKQRTKQVWSCAILRVMHTIAHIEGVGKIADTETAFKQIRARFLEHLNYDNNKHLWLGTPGEGIPLELVEWKPRKRRNSIILKLLHKPANVAETIYDLIGVRLVTKRLCDTMWVIKYLLEKDLLAFPNCNPTRARNNLLDVSRFRDNIKMLEKMSANQRIGDAELDLLIEQMTRPVQSNPKSRVNPHSLSSYRSIQLTCRQLIRFPHPLNSFLDKMSKMAAAGNVDPSTASTLNNVGSIIRSWSGAEVQEQAIFHPFELQIQDRESYDQTERGDAAHDRYKLAQLRSVRRRVLAEVLRL